MKLTIDGILESVVGGALWSIAVVILRLIYKRFIKTKYLARIKSAKSLYFQFFLWLFLLIISFGVLLTVQTVAPLGFSAVIKTAAGLVALFSFIFLWGTFDAALVYPEGNNTED